MNCARILVVMLAWTALAGCPDLDDGAGEHPLSPLRGTWLGPYAADPAAGAPPPAAMQVSVGAAGGVTRVSIGGVDQNLTGTISATSTPRLFSLRLSDGSQGVLLADESFAYVALVMNGAGLPMAALQKEATALPAYAAGDVGGTWSGTAVALDAGFNATGTTVYTAGVACSGAGCAMAFVGPWADAFTAAAGGYYAASGGGGQTYEYLLLTPDKRFAAAALLCGAGALSLSTCRFAAWRRSPASAEVEPDSTYAQARALALPALVSGSAAGTGASTPGGCEYGWSAAPLADPDYYRITLASAARVMLLLNGEAGDIDLLLCSADGAAVLAAGQQAGALEYVFSPTLPSGTYLVGVLPWANAAPTAYTLSIVEW